MPTLYLVATPIGNLEDITLRALRTLKEVDLIASEDTRKTRQLLNHYSIKTPLTSYHEHNEIKKLPFLLQKLEGMDIALVSDAGTPGLNDPGFELVSACIQHKIKVVPIPGPSAVLTALVVSGISPDQFVFLGYMPRKAGDRKKTLASLASETRTTIVLEVPHRLSQTLEDIKAQMPNRKIALCRELTKIHEEVFLGTAEEALQHFQSPRGEFVVVIERAKESKEDVTTAVEARLKELKKQGKSARDSVKEVAEAFGVPRREAYQLRQRLER